MKANPPVMHLNDRSMAFVQKLVQMSLVSLGPVLIGDYRTWSVHVVKVL